MVNAAFAAVLVFLSLILTSGVTREKDKNPSPRTFITEAEKDLSRAGRGDLILLKNGTNRVVLVVTSVANGRMMVQSAGGMLAQVFDKKNPDFLRLVRRNETFDYRFWSAKYVEQVAEVESLK